MHCLFQLLLGCVELVQAGMRGALESEHLYEQIFVLGQSRRRTKHCQRLPKHAPPQQGFGFQNSELPSPLGAGTAQSLVLAIGIILTLSQIAAQKGPVDPFISSLRALVTTTTREPADNDQNQKRRRYGIVCPLVLDLPALMVPSPTQPNSMLSIVTSK